MFLEDIIAPTNSQKSLTRFELLSQAMKEGIWDYNLATGETYYNNTIGNMFGYTQEEMGNNKEWWETNLHPEDKSRIINDIDNAVTENKATWSGTYLFRCKDGSYKSVLERLYIIRSREGELERILGTMQDLSKVNTLENQLFAERKINAQKRTQKIISKEEEEKRKIGYELNENINQILASINFYLNLAKTDTREQSVIWINKAQELIRSSITDVRKISDELSPHTLDLLGLSSSLDKLLTKMYETSNIKSTLHFDENLASVLTPQKQLALYRIAYHQFDNICNHSLACFVKINIEVKNEKIKLTIVDNGNGFDNNKLIYGFGFSKIQTITEAFHGSFNVHSQPGKGCELQAII